MTWGARRFSKEKGIYHQFLNNHEKSFWSNCERPVRMLPYFYNYASVFMWIFAEALFFFLICLFIYTFC